MTQRTHAKLRSLQQSILRLLIVCTLFVGPSSPIQAQRWLHFDNELDRFAARHLNEVQEMSIRDGVEYCGYIGVNGADEFVATKAKKGKKNGCLPSFFLPWGLDIIASYHTHGSYDPNADTEVPSIRDLESDIDEKVAGYIATPGGRLWVNLSSERRTILLCGRGCLRSDPNFLECEATFPRNSYTLPELFERFENELGTC